MSTKPHDVAMYSVGEARRIIRALGAATLPAESTLRRRFVCMSLAEIVAVATKRGATGFAWEYDRSLRCRILYPFGKGGGVWISPKHAWGHPAIENTRLGTRFVCGDVDKWLRDRDNHYTNAEAEAALRFERLMRGEPE